jgi:hypothetical protein
MLFATGELWPVLGKREFYTMGRSAHTMSVLRLLLNGDC